MLESNNSAKLAPKEDGQDDNTQSARRNSGSNPLILRAKGGLLRLESLKPSFDTVSENCELNTSQGDSTFSSGAHISAASGFTWAKRRNEDGTKSAVSDGSKSQFSALDTNFAKSTFDFTRQGNGTSKIAMRKLRTFDTSELCRADESEDTGNDMDSIDEEKHVIEYSGRYFPNRVEWMNTCGGMKAIYAMQLADQGLKER